MLAYSVNLHRVEYSYTQSLQNLLVKGRRTGSIPDVLLLLEHMPVVTVGRGGGMENLILPVSELQHKGISLYRTERGGNITYHGPGQLVVYPIVNLKVHQPDVHWYVRLLERAIINVLKTYGISGSVDTGRTGVWVGKEKIAAIGVGVRHWVTFHGLALNVNTDLSPFQHIVPCGLHGFGVTSMHQLLGRQANMEDVRRLLANQLGCLLQLDLKDISVEELEGMLLAKEA